MVSTEKTKISRPITTTAQRAKTTAQTKRERISAASSSPTPGPLRSRNTKRKSTMGTTTNCLTATAMAWERL